MDETTHTKHKLLTCPPPDIKCSPRALGEAGVVLLEAVLEADTLAYIIITNNKNKTNNNNMLYHMIV